MSQFVVPQFIDVEDKILGPITVRQFIILLVIGGVDFLLYYLLDFLLFLIIGLPVFLFGSTVAFVRVNGQPFHFYLLNLLQYARRPRVKFWDKSRTDEELRALGREHAPPPSVTRVHKEPLSSSRLMTVSLVVNTGGVYRPEEWETVESS